jgi:hypothetical protein
VEALIALHPPRLLFMDLPATQCTLLLLLLRLLLLRLLLLLRRRRRRRNPQCAGPAAQKRPRRAGPARH